jgi:hypothetical protein
VGAEVTLINTTSDFIAYLKPILDSAKSTTTPQIADVWIGDMNKLPRTPAVTLEPGEKRREYNGLPRKTLVILEAFVCVYYGAVQDVELNLQGSISLAEQIEAVLHQDAQLGGNVISSMVTMSEPGVVMKSGALTRATRLTFQAQSQQLLPSSF